MGQPCNVNCWEDTLFEDGSTGAAVENWLEMHRTAEDRSMATEDAMWEASELIQKQNKNFKRDAKTKQEK